MPYGNGIPPPTEGFGYNEPEPPGYDPTEQYDETAVELVARLNRIVNRYCRAFGPLAEE